MNYWQLKAQEIDAAQAIRKLAEAEKRAVSAEELTKIEAHLARAGEYAELAKRENATMASLDAGIKALEQPQPRRAAAAIPAQPKADTADWRKDPKKGFATPREFFGAIIERQIKGKRDERLEFLATAGSDEHQTQNDPSGGFLVPVGFSPDLLKIMPENDPTIGRTRNIPMGAPRVEIPARVDENHTTSVAGGITVSRKEETATGATSRMKFQKVALNAHTLFGASFVTEELLQDSPITVAALLAAGFGEAFTDKLFDEKLNGTGVGEYEGVTNSAAFVSQAKEAGQAADSVMVENILKMRSRCWGYQNAIWLANHDTYPGLAKLGGDANGNGQLIWQPSLGDDRPDILLGRPIFFTEYTQKLGDANDIVLINWSEYLEGLYSPMQSEESIHVRFLENERCFKFWLRNDGRGWWKAALTPRKGSLSLSPFIGLAERA